MAHSLVMVWIRVVCFIVGFQGSRENEVGEDCEKVAFQDIIKLYVACKCTAGVQRFGVLRGLLIAGMDERIATK